MILSIEEFIKTAIFGPVEVGMSKKRVIDLLGAPDSDNDIGANGDILLYAWYELFINHEDKLYSIQNDNYDPNDPESYEFRNEKIKIDSWFLNSEGNQDIESISELLASRDIAHTIEDYFGRNAIKAKSGVVIDFQDEVNEDGVMELIGIRYWPFS